MARPGESPRVHDLPPGRPSGSTSRTSTRKGNLRPLEGLSLELVIWTLRGTTPLGEVVSQAYGC